MQGMSDNPLSSVFLCFVPRLARVAVWFFLSLTSVLTAQEPAAAPEPEPQAVVVECITFHASAGVLYAPVMEAADALGWPAECSIESRALMLNGIAVPKDQRRTLTDGIELVSTAGLAAAGATVTLHPSGQSATVAAGSRSFTLLRAEKRVEISLGEQKLRAWQGSRLVLQTNVSTGRSGRTPAGNFVAGPYRARMHHSRKYNNAPMPWSVQINGPIFVHGFTSVPSYPASHGCVRMPLGGRNPARFFYEWVDTGTPVKILPVVKSSLAAEKKKKS